MILFILLCDIFYLYFLLFFLNNNFELNMVVVEVNVVILNIWFLYVILFFGLFFSNNDIDSDINL